MIETKKIFFVAPCLAMGGMERAASNTANGLSGLGCNVIFLSLFKKSHFFKLNREVRLIEPDNFNERRLDFWKSVFWIRRLIFENKPDEVLAFNKFYGAITAIALIGTEHTFSISERSSPFFNWGLKLSIINWVAYFLNPPKCVISQTQIAADFHSKYYRNSSIKVIPNSLRHIELFPELKRENFILAVGRMNDRLKGFDLLFQSIAIMKNLNWKLYLAGGDKEDSELIKLAQTLGILPRIKFLGKVTEIDTFYATAGVFVIPSRSEGFPNALAEAMGAGCCCVSFDFIAGPRDLINDGINGFIVEASNIQMLSERLDWLIDNQEIRLRVGLNAIEIRERLKLEKVTKEIYDFITK
jgi:GalNAc-alpha-(1->4)-GalNAc-alpha-(1->3)-diNAcBac-PP-undecaprenol alpha-1,4-N-acetyl-D-galactosaminyltransferase